MIWERRGARISISSQGRLILTHKCEECGKFVHINLDEFMEDIIDHAETAKLIRVAIEILEDEEDV